MTRETKPVVSFDETFARLDIRVGRIIDVEPCTQTPKPTYKMVVDFGKFGVRTCYGRFTTQPLDQVKGRLVLGVLNLPAKPMGDVVSEALLLGVQAPGADSGEALFVAPAGNAKIGSKLF
jgi:tRNA-binding protein